MSHDKSREANPPSEPPLNFQNLPARGEGADVIKRAVVPKRGSFSFFDYKAVEPRLVAYYTALLGYPDFAEQIKAGVDPYMAVARLASGEDELTDAERDTWKTVFLAILYGAGPKRIRDTWIERTKEEISLSEAKAIYLKFHRNWPAVKALQEAVLRQHEKNGFIRSIAGRHLHMEDGGDYKLANKLIQGSAAEIMKEAMLAVDAWLQSRPDVESRMVVVVHDELGFDGPEAEIELLHEVVPQLMVHEEVNKVVPILVDHEVSLTSWADKMSYAEWKESIGKSRCASAAA